MKFVPTLLALALATAAGSAAAAPIDLGNLTGSTVPIGNTFAASTLFADVYLFDITGISSHFAGTAVSINLDIPLFPDPEFHISDFKIEILDPSGNPIASNIPSGPGDFTLDLGALLPVANDYRLVVSGNVTGQLGGTYGGALAAAPVPEPETYAMLLAGLGLVGYMVQRRRNVL